MTDLSTITRFWGKVDKRGADECWPWLGGVMNHKRPYGVFSERGENGKHRGVRAHRFSYRVNVGPIPEGDWCICHRCDNPRCVNPKHLFLGTKKDNADDRDRKNRNSPPPYMVGETHASARITSEQIRAIIASPLPSSHIGAAMGIDDSYIRAIRRGERRKSDLAAAPATDEGECR